MEFFKSSDSLKKDINLLSAPLLKDRDSIFPKWFLSEGGVTNKSLIICGSTSREEIRTLALNFQIVAIVDDELSKKWKWLFGIPLISSSQWIDLVKADMTIVSLILVGTLRSYRHFVKQSIQHGFNYLTPIQILHFLEKNSIQMPSTGLIFRYGIHYFDFALNNIEELISLCDIFVDEYSKISYLNILLYKLTLNPFYLENTAVGRGQYYDYNTYLFDRTYLNLSSDEVYVDAGAFTGDSIQNFLFAVKGEFKHIYAFEPDPKNNLEMFKHINKLQEFYLKSLLDSITFVKKGVWSENSVLEFLSTKDHDLGGHMIESGMGLNFNMFNTTKIEVTSIDTATDQDATFIKYEVEGSELEGLIGAQKTIEKNKPKLAVAIYHKAEDILTLPKYISNLNMGYKIGFRQHDLYKPDATYLYCF
jgi:FkbM family methyltransferase